MRRRLRVKKNVVSMQRLEKKEPVYSKRICSLKELEIRQSPSKLSKGSNKRRVLTGTCIDLVADLVYKISKDLRREAESIYN